MRILNQIDDQAGECDRSKRSKNPGDSRRRNRRLRLEREAHEAGPEVDERVPVFVELCRAARAFRKHQEEPVFLEQPNRVLG